MGVVVRVLVLVLVLLVLLLVGVVRVVATVEDARPLIMMPAMAKRAACERRLRGGTVGAAGVAGAYGGDEGRRPRWKSRPNPRSRKAET